MKLKVVKIGENGITEDDILVHDTSTKDPTIHFMLARMCLPETPVALGVIRSYKTITYEVLLENQIKEEQKNSKIKNVEDLLNSGNVFEIK